jgi:RNA polymerase sigma-70 factor (ECF subfamily)
MTTPEAPIPVPIPILCSSFVFFLDCSGIRSQASKNFASHHHFRNEPRNGGPYFSVTLALDSGAVPIASASVLAAVPSPPASEPDVGPPPSGVSTSAAAEAQLKVRLVAIVREHYQFIWRSLRRLGVPEADCDDAAQRVLSVVAKKLPEVAPRAEKSFVFQTALRVASDARRAYGRARTVPDEDAVAGARDAAPSPEDEMHRKQARARLDEILDGLQTDLRAVFVLFELEEMSTNEIAALLSIPPGTVSSRLARARQEFQALAARARATEDRRRP